MNFNSFRSVDGLNYFQARVNDLEFYSLESKRELGRLTDYIITKLALMVAGYYFKHHKDEIIEFLKSDEIKQMIAKELANQIKVELIK